MSELPRIGHEPVSENPSDLDPGSQGPDPTVLDGLMTDLEKVITDEVEFVPITLEVAKRPGVSIRYGTRLDDTEVTRWRKISENKKLPNDFDNLRFCLLIVASKCEAILLHGEEVRDEAGQLITFGHKWTRDKMKTGDRAADAARKLIGSDPHVMLHANRILDEAGFGDDAVDVEEGPTQ